MMSLEFRTSGSTNLFNDEVLLYPNPATVSISLHLKSLMDQEIDYTIFNHAGHLVMGVADHKATNPELRIDLSESHRFINGLYLLVIHSKEETIAKQFVIANY